MSSPRLHNLSLMTILTALSGRGKTDLNPAPGSCYSTPPALRSEVGTMQIPAPFDYVRATTVENALELLARHGPESRIIAGGHSLLPMMKLRLARPEWLIDINDVAALDHITEDGDWLRIGALTRHAALLASDVVGRLFPIVHDAERVIADPVVRNRGTIGGSLGQADPAEDLTTVCDVLRASVVIAGPSGERVVEMADFHRG